MNFYRFYQLINEYGENLKQTLIEKFLKEDPDLNPDIIRRYIDRFENIKNNLPEKDITKYSWKDLENAVDGYQGKQRIKAGKLDSTVTDANLIVNKDNIRIYLGKDKKSCVKYSNGYTFCIGARGENNMYDYYRISKKGTPYFIFNDNLPSTNNKHLIVLFIYKNSWLGETSYGVTLADNQHEHQYPSIESVLENFPWVESLIPFLKDKKGIVEPDPIEVLEHYLKTCMFNAENSLRIVGENLKYPASLHSSLSFLIKSSDQQKTTELFNDNIQIALVRMYPVLFYGEIPIKDAESAEEINTQSIGLDFPRYFTFFTKDSNETLKNIKQKIKYFLEEYKLKDNSNEVMEILNQKEQIFQNLLENNKTIKESLVTSKPPLANKLTSFSQLFKNQGDTTIVPYLVIQVNGANEELKELINKNKEEIEIFYDLKKRYGKCVDYIKTLTKDQQQKILDFCDAISDTGGGDKLGGRDLFDNSIDGCFVFKIIEYFMNNNDAFNKNLQINTIAQNIYYLKRKAIERLIKYGP